MFMTMLFFSPNYGDLVKAATKPILSSRGFEVIYDHSNPGERSVDIGYKRTSDGAFVMVQGNRASSAKDVVEFRKSFAHTSGADVAESAPSGIPLGDFSFVINNGKEVVASADGFMVKVDLPSAQSLKDPANDSRAIEASVRVSLADLIGSTVGPDYKPVEKQNYSIERPHTTYLSFKNLSRINSLKVTQDGSGDRGTFMFKGHRFEFILGSDAMLLDGKVDKLEAFVARKDGVWLIPGKDLPLFGFKVK